MLEFEGPESEGRFDESMRSNRIQFKPNFPSPDLKKWSSWHLAIKDRTRQIFISGAAYHQIIDSNSIVSRKRDFFGPENDFSGKETSIDLEFAEFRKKALNSRRSAWKMVVVSLCQDVQHSSKLWAWTTRSYLACTLNLHIDINIESIHCAYLVLSYPCCCHVLDVLLRA